MRIAVLGTGLVGRAIAGRLAELDHQTVLGTRDLHRTNAREDFAAWARGHPDVDVATFADAARASETLVNATNGAASIEVLESAGEQNFDHKVLIDVANPLDPTSGMPPRLFLRDDDSLGEMIQRRFPGARVIKTLNTMNNQIMIDPASLGEPTSVFVCGDDQDAKDVVVRLLRQMGHSDIIDLGDISAARGAEMFVSFWVRVALALETPHFNIKIVR